ncbi:MAG: glycosyltransferase family 4 protein [Candidatus Methylomirabilales bacterium]
MKVLITTGIFPPDIGGPATYVTQVAKGLTERGHDVTVFTLSDHASASPPNPTSKAQYPFRVASIPRQTFKPWRSLRTVAALIRLGADADALFVNGLALEAVLANLLLRVPMVLKVVGDLAWERATNCGWVKDGFEDFQKKRYGPELEALKALRAWWTRRADRVIVPSRYLARWVCEWGVPEKKIVVIYNAVEPFNGIHPTEVSLRMPFKVVTVGRLVPWKHVDDILEAVSRVRGAGLVVIGDGPECANLEKQGRSLGITERIYFAGAKSREETLALMAGCDLFVLNSSYEGFPHVVLEAMSIGLPVIAKHSGGTPEVVEDKRNGRLIEPMNGGQLTEAILDLLTTPDHRRHLAEAARRTTAQFTLNRMVHETEETLEALTRGKVSS